MDLAECERNINDVKIINTTVLKNNRIGLGKYKRCHQKRLGNNRKGVS